MSKLTIQQSLGSAIRRRRLLLGLSQEEFSEVAGMHRTQFAAIEQGRKDCRLSTIVRVSAALQVEVSKLMSEAVG
ncbi:helix-turn-helix domain-containing protein [Luteimonas sp. WGS1318]|uniref:helix-turn-helix domain-containing protein n=1 Tax=Luteimonas sp. WGS1318 TaxID=3366815 RepID=UPI00372CEE1D